MTPKTFRTALITGASAGLGAAYARRLAAAGTNLVLVARRLDRLEALARELRARHGVTVETVRADLSTEEGLAAVEASIAKGATLDLLVNNAGFGGKTGFVRGEIEDHIAMVRVHVDATVRLTKAALAGMIARGQGAIINVASVAAFSPVSGAMYSGTKAFLVKFSENLQAQVGSKGIVVQALCPGMTRTEFHAAAGMDVSDIPRLAWMTSDDVVRFSLKRLGRGVICIPGLVNKVVAFFMRCPLTAGMVRAARHLRMVKRKSAGD